MANRVEFLESIRHRTRTGKYKPTHAPDIAWTPKGEPREREPIQDLPALFLEELEALEGSGERVGSVEEVRDYVLSLAQEKGAKRLLRWDDEELERLDVDRPLTEAEVEVAVWRDLNDFREVSVEADIGLTTAEWAVAETGSLILAGGPGRGRTVALLPPTHVAVIPVERVLSTVSEAIEKYAEAERLPANVCFHTGPSRSGDIEMSLTIGMHGPGDVRVVLVG